jgi:kinesin family protein C2/C3
MQQQLEREKQEYESTLKDVRQNSQRGNISPKKSESSGASAAKSVDSKELSQLKAQLEKQQSDAENYKQKLSKLTEKYNKDMKAAVDKIKKHKSNSSTSNSANILGQAQTMQTTIKKLKSEQQLLKKDAREYITQLKNDMTKLSKSGLGNLSEAIDEITKKYHKEVRERRKLFNELQEMKGNIRVYVRVRPVLPSDETIGACIECLEGELRLTDMNKKNHRYEFERVFDQNSTQQQVFNDVKPLATSILDGYNVCIFAYGQTGSGKTHTMEGNATDRGVNYRILNELFHIIQERKSDYSYEISVAVMEIYNETLVDLLSKDKQKLEIKMSSSVAVPGLTTLSVSSTENVIEVLSMGYKNRATGANNINKHSSRSHCIVSVYVDGVNLITQQKVRGKLHLIDLAGSERLKRTGTEGDRLKETLAINKSLSCLGNVISALASKNAHVPYRNSKLTSLLQDSLGGNSKTLMFVNVSPTVESAPETICSLGFAQRVNKVELGKAEKNVA